MPRSPEHISRAVLIWDSTPLFIFRRDEPIIDSTKELFGYDHSSVYIAVSPALTPRFTERNDDGDLLVAGHSLFFQRDLYLKEYPDGHTVLSSGGDLQAIYRFPNRSVPIWIDCVTYTQPGKPPNPELPDYFRAGFKASIQKGSPGLSIEYHPHSGELQKLTFDLPTEEPRHPVFGPEMTIDLSTLFVDYRPHGVLKQPRDAQTGERIKSPQSPLVTFQCTQRGSVMEIGIFIEEKPWLELRLPLSVKFNEGDVLEQLTPTKSISWLDPNFLKIMNQFEAKWSGAT